MTRCFRLFCLSACIGAALSLVGLPAVAQPQAPAPSGASARSFPRAALRGTVTYVSGKLQLNGEPVRSAPGLRIFNAKNQLVKPFTLRDKTFTVNYVIERSTGMLHTVWLLTEAEAAQPRAAPGMVVRNFQFESQQPDSTEPADSTERR